MSEIHISWMLMPSLKNADVINVDIMSAMHITNIDVMSEKHWCHECRCHVWKTLMIWVFLKHDMHIDDVCILDMTSTFMT
jgi:hypothetical protein